MTKGGKRPRHKDSLIHKLTHFKFPCRGNNMKSTRDKKKEIYWLQGESWKGRS